MKDKKIFVDGFSLKVIAIIAMFINHIGVAFKLGHSNPAMFTLTEFIGKLTFPIMAFLVVEGFFYTRSVKKYAMRLAFFWIISIYPFHWLHFPLTSGITLDECFNNVLFTLLMGLLMLWFYQNTSGKLAHIFIVLFFTIATGFSDVQFIDPLIMFGFFKIKKMPEKIIYPISIVTIIMEILYLIIFYVSPKSLPGLTVLTPLGLLMTIPFLLRYNGKRGYNPKFVKWGFYWFYPLHLVCIEIIRLFILGW